jgi:double-strand break repair protein MRE11
MYGLGNIRDERLCRAFERGKVTFMRPHGHSDWFHLLVIHQNRHGRGNYGPKAAIKDENIPKFMDLVVWGHEHECKVEENEERNGEFYVTQPGSTVATSLCDGEAVKKHIGLVDVCGDQFKLEAIRLETPRPFTVAEVCAHPPPPHTSQPHNSAVQKLCLKKSTSHLRLTPPPHRCAWPTGRTGCAQTPARRRSPTSWRVR